MSKGYRQLLCENKPCLEVNFDSLTEQLQADYLDRYEGVQAQTHQVCQFDYSNVVSTTYVGRTERSRSRCHKGSTAIFNHRSV